MRPHVIIRSFLCSLMLSVLAGCATRHEPPVHAYFKPDRIDQFTDYILVNPKDAKAYHQRGKAYEAKGDTARALKDYNKALKINPGLALVYWNRGLLYYKLNDLKHALKDLNHYQEFVPRSATVMLLRGMIYYKKGQHGRAIDAFRKVARMDGRYTGIAYLDLATIYMERKNYYRAWIYANKKEAAQVKADPKNCFKAGKDMQLAGQFMVLNTHDELVKKLRGEAAAQNALSPKTNDAKNPGPLIISARS